MSRKNLLATCSAALESLRLRVRSQVPGVLRSCASVLLIVLGLVALVGLSFLFTGGFTFQAYSDRLLWVGIAATLIGGIVGVGGGMVASARRESSREGPSPGTPARTPGARSAEGKHYSFAFRFWAIGLLCIAASVLVTKLLGGS